MITLKGYNEETVRGLAHQIWEDEGRPDGRDEIHWQWALAKFQDTTVAAATDISLIDGVGPKITAQLAAQGITSLVQIAKLSVDELADLDATLGLKGRSAREVWISQAKELVAGKAPRAKIDQAKVAKKK